MDAADILLKKAPAGTVSIRVVAAAEWKRKRQWLTAPQLAWAEANAFEAGPLAVLLFPHQNGTIAGVLVGAPKAGEDAFALGALASRLPSGTYAFEGTLASPELVALGWCLERYTYAYHRAAKIKAVRLVCPKGVEHAKVTALANVSFAVRDQVNMPANLFGPDELEAAACQVAKANKANVKVVTGPRLAREFPLIHAVGAASAKRPRLIDFTWGNPRHPKVTLVGKGVCFDTGGLDLKPPSGMLLMKKDMGGAANVLGLAQLVMWAKLKVRLRVLIPAVENAISGHAFRPGDIFRSRKGLTVEIGNTDAEGRLILCDALALADEEAPDLLIDMATLTGAARAALGPDLVPFYTDDDELAEALAAHAARTNDPLWRMPLWRSYESMIDSSIADINNAGQGGFAGSITAALYLRRFVEKAKAYLHFDLFAWVPTAKPGRPKGGEQQAMRAVFSLLTERYG